MNARLAACAAAILASGCATLPPPGDGDWPARREALQALDDWTLTGRVAVAAGAEGFSGGLRWRQDGTRAEIDMRGPLGGTALAIRVDGEAITVTDASGATLGGEQARRITREYVGAPLPLSELRYWLLGAPAPDSAFRETLGADARLAALEQAGWQVRFTRYGAAGGRVLPERLELIAGDVRLRLVVSGWQFAP
ncbi:MAG TPA: lipoprotein insertase outer membrane protein LolB [Steroidobacteraceae bacterium]|nr:lipoprotein insertase outer membrane protein LolB [Steroidobacteraceae bacterium]